MNTPSSRPRWPHNDIVGPGPALGLLLLAVTVLFASSCSSDKKEGETDTKKAEAMLEAPDEGDKKAKRKGKGKTKAKSKGSKKKTANKAGKRNAKAAQAAKGKGAAKMPGKGKKTPTKSGLNIKVPAPAKAVATPKGNALEALVNSTLTKKEVEAATGYKGAMRVSGLDGADTSDTYGAIRLRPMRGDGFGVSLQVWSTKTAGKAGQKFSGLMKQYPESKRERGTGDSSFSAKWGGIHYLVWLDRSEKKVAAVSCDQSVCRDAASATTLAKRIEKRLTRGK